MKKIQQKRTVPYIKTALLVLGTFIIGASVAQTHAETLTLEAENFSLPSWSGQPYDDDQATNKKGLLIWSNNTASTQVNLDSSLETIVVRARADNCSGSPVMQISLDNKVLKKFTVAYAQWTDYTIPVQSSAGTHNLAIAFTNDTMTDWCDRNLRLDSVRFTTTEQPQVTPTPTTPTAPTVAPSPTPTAPVNSTTTTTPTVPVVQQITSAQSAVSNLLDIDPSSPAKQQADKWRAEGSIANATLLDKIANSSQASWFGDWSGDIRTAVSARVTAATSRNAVPVLVAYNIPNRDCGNYSAGGMSSASAYKTWIDQFAAGINGKKAIVIVEPDAVVLTDCLSATDKQTRYELLRYAGQALTKAGATAYLDAGHANWKSVDDISNSLKSAGIESYQGFSLNVSNFVSTPDSKKYGSGIRAKLGNDTSYVIDTSRNGKASAGTEWCNPFNQALGERPTTTTGVDGIDAYLWVKRPGESDGNCNGGPSAGQWWLDYAMNLAKSAAY